MAAAPVVPCWEEMARPGLRAQHSRVEKPLLALRALLTREHPPTLFSYLTDSLTPLLTAEPIPPPLRKNNNLLSGVFAEQGPIGNTCSWIPDYSTSVTYL